MLDSQKTIQKLWKMMQITILSQIHQLEKEGYEIKRIRLEEKLEHQLSIHHLKIETNRLFFPNDFYVRIYKEKVRDGILMIRDGVQAKEFIETIYENINHLLIFTEDIDRWEEYVGWLYEETGLLVQYGSSVSCCQETWKHHVLFDFSENKEVKFRSLPHRIHYLDFFPSFEKERVITVKRKDISYFAYPEILKK